MGDLIFTFLGGQGDLLDDQHRNTNMNDKDHLVGQLTTSKAACDAKMLLSKSIILIFSILRQNDRTEIGAITKTSCPPFSD